MSPQRFIRRLIQWSVAPLGVALLSIATMQPASQAQPPGQGDAAGANVEQPEGATVLTRGPIHEAFGQPTVFNPKPGLLIPKKPPQAVEELPPDEKPEGDNVAWIGGYWSWDEDKSDFMWISGFWRVLPPNRQWMPGYWNETDGQFQWVSGYWASAEEEVQEVIQQPPPDTLEQGAPPTAPSQDHIWAPGTWVYRDTRYLWRPGYWVVNQPGWAWVPSTYIWTPSGYIFVDGYWDWSIRRRGIIFAPCYFDYRVCYRPGYYYRPTVCLDIDVITPHFFCRPRYSHYYFGDYYASSYLSIGITPWFNFTYARGSRFYSSDFAYYECHYRRSNPQWAVQIRTGYERYRDNPTIRPARTFVAQQTMMRNTTIINNNIVLAKPMKSYTASMAKNADAPIRFERINDTKARDFGKTASEVRKIGTQRVQLEKSLLSTPGKTGSNAGSTTAIRSINMPKSPIVSKMPLNAGSDANTKTLNPGSIGTQASKLPPPVPGGSGIKSRISGGSGSTTGTTGTGTGTGAGSSKTLGGAGSSGASKMGSTTGSGSTGAGSSKGSGTGIGGTGSGSSKGSGTGIGGTGSGSSKGSGSGIGGTGSGSSKGSGSGIGGTGSGSSKGSGSGSGKDKGKDKN